METRNLICIGCPMGCMMEVKLENGEVVTVSGNSCLNGDRYARKEVTNPTRIVTSSVLVSGARDGSKTVSVKTASDIPKARIFDAVRDLRGITVNAPVHIGDVVFENVAGTGVNMIATKEVL